MKKLIALVLSYIFFTGNVGYCATPIIDEFVENSLKSVGMPIKYKQPPIKDEFIEKTLIGLQPQKIIPKQPIVDELGQYLSTQNLKIDKKTPVKITDSLNEISIFLISDTFVTTRRNIAEGKMLDFTVSKDVVANGKIIIQKGTKATGRVELITMNSAFGSPADLTVGNFILQDGSVLIGQIKKNGANRSIWVYPAGYFGSFFFGAGMLLFAVRGGHAKIKPNQQYELNYPLSGL